ncbi:c-type cytochrome [Undibacterium sp. Jales W-56]|uniref:c-type cytochrome n=1 Tax=Undibacterium sp. Jales W-56 TaxID=2897325 RepID=UPI0021D374A8|nr:c-type cytochrome [Undibacterium sp. Jales W-56]MCU6432977.1 c-type cytochrome [Undibacterium sp. Jales W-56]
MKKHTLLALLLTTLSAVSLSAVAGGNIEAGKAAAEKAACFSCHGKDYNSPIDPSYPKLAGQHKDYIAHALKAYQHGVDAPNGRGNAIMGAQAKALSNADIENIAAYLNSLPGSIVMRK